MKQNNNIKELFLSELKKFTRDEEVGPKLIKFCEYIDKSNKLHNLTSIKKLDDMLIKHVLDSLSIKYLINGENILDIGSGAGLPGIPLALTLPKKNFLLLDSNNKKIIFLNHVKINLDIMNASALHETIESLKTDTSFDTVICRSFAKLTKIYSNSIKHLVKDGTIIAMKGKYPKQELDELVEFDKNVVFEVEKLKVPELSAERHAVIIYKK